MIVFAAIMPHPPESIPGIGRTGDFKALQKTLHAFEELRTGLEQADPETIVIISPHAHLEQFSFAINSASELVGNFSQFGLDQAYKFTNDIEIADKLGYMSNMNEIPANLHPDFLDYGALIPLYHLTKNIKPKIVHLSFSMMSYDFHYRYGETLQDIVTDNIVRDNVKKDRTNKRVAIIASADLSHRLTKNAPAGFSPKAQDFDRTVLHYLGSDNLPGIMNLDEKDVAEAGECGLRSIIILLGALHGKPYEFKLLSYESPIGVGYLTARLV